MKITDIFRIGGITQSIDGRSPFLDWDNCQIENKTLGESDLILHLKRKSDSEEGRIHLRVLDKFKSIEGELIKWAFSDSSMLGLTLNELSSLDANIDIHEYQGRLTIRK